MTWLPPSTALVSRNAFLRRKGNESQDFFATAMEKRYPSRTSSASTLGKAGGSQEAVGPPMKPDTMPQIRPQ